MLFLVGLAGFAGLLIDWFVSGTRPNLYLLVATLWLASGMVAVPRLMDAWSPPPAKPRDDGPVL